MNFEDHFSIENDFYITAPVSRFSKFITHLDLFRKSSKLRGEIVECGVLKNLKIVDLTGAGDLFAAGFLHGYINNLSIKKSLEKGTEMSSKVIQRIGARL